MEKKLIDIVVLGLYNEKIKGLLAGKEVAGAAAQALADAKVYADAEIEKLSFDEAGTAKTLADAAEKNAKDYADGEVAKKQDIIEDLATIRSGAAAGATALQETDLQFATAADIDGLFA